MKLSLATLLLLPIICFGQTDPAHVDELLRLPKGRQLKFLWDTYLYNNEQERTYDTTAQLAQYDFLEEELRQRGENDLAREVWLMRNVYRAVILYLGQPQGVWIMQRAADEAADRDWDVIEAECIMYTGVIYLRQYNYGPAFEHMLRAYKRLKELGFDKNPHTIRHLSNIGYAYYAFEDYPSAILYFKEVLNIPPPWNEGGFHRQTLNTIGLCFQRQAMYDSAIHYYDLSYAEALTANDTFWAALANGNKGQAYLLSGRYAEAVPLLETDYLQSILHQEYGSALSAALELAAIAIRDRDESKSEEYLAFVTQHLSPTDLRSRSRYYKNKYELAKLRRDYTLAISYADSFHIFRDSLLMTDDSRINNRIKQNIEVEQYTHEIRMLEAARNRQILMRNAMLAIIILSGGLVALWINRQRLKHRKEREVQLIKQQIAEGELQRAKDELHAFTEQLRQRNDLIDTFQAELDTLRGATNSDSTGKTNQERSEQISALLNATILTEDDWKDFRRMFDKVHPGFFGSLKERYPDLTPADLRLLALTKLRLAPREMTAMLGVSYDAIKKSRKRLLARLELPEEESLGGFVESIG